MVRSGRKGRAWPTGVQRAAGHAPKSATEECDHRVARSPT